MGYIDLHSKPFDEGTLKKLEFFEDYTKSWLPTFVMYGAKNIHIFDLFAGPGYDQNKIPGSPIRILNTIYDQIGNIFSKRTHITLHFNEYEPKKKTQAKFELLKENCKDFLNKHPRLKHCTEIKYYNQDAGLLFNSLLLELKKYPSLLFLDQNGVRFISKEYINLLKSIRTLDFLYFVSSSYLKRFGTTEEFKKVIPFTKRELQEIEWNNIHREVVSKLEGIIGDDSDLRLYPYSIKKSGNIYGLIFGASHPLAVDKFLKIAWKKNETNGEADFDIDDDKNKYQPDLFFGKRLTKIEKFEKELEEKILKSTITNNKEALDFTYKTGNYYKYASDLILNLKRKGKIYFDGNTSGVNYDNVYKKKNLVNYRLR